MAEPATRHDLQALVNDHLAGVLRALGLPLRDVQLSIPMEGMPRLRVSVRPGVDAKLPSQLEIPFGRRRRLLVSLEVNNDFQQYQLQ